MDFPDLTMLIKCNGIHVVLGVGVLFFLLDYQSKCQCVISGICNLFGSRKVKLVNLSYKEID
jgi:hypothetical protein